jgi:hypothetical protein
VDLSFDLLAAHVGDTFTVTAATADGTQAQIDLVLVSARPNPDDHPGGLLSFSGPLDRELVQGTYAARHGEIGEGPLFIVPTARTDAAMTYEAVFG